MSGINLERFVVDLRHHLAHEGELIERGFIEPPVVVKKRQPATEGRAVHVVVGDFSIHPQRRQRTAGPIKVVRRLR